MKKFEDVCKKDEYWNSLKDIKFPKVFSYLSDLFIKIWITCKVDFNGNRQFCAEDVLNYCKLTGIKLNFYEGRLLLKMGEWAISSIYKSKEDSEKED